MKHFLILLVWFFFSSNIGAKGLQIQDSLQLEKLVLAVGFGQEYSVLGARGTYFFNDNVGVFTVVGLAKTFGLLSLPGIELRFPNMINHHWIPSFTFMMGNDEKIDLRFRRENTNKEELTVSSSKAFYAMTFGAQMRFRFRKSPGLSLIGGVSFRRVSKNANAFIENFNQKYNATYSYRRMYFVPSIGIAFNLSKAIPE